MVPDAILVGGSAAALYAGHRDSYDHDHVLTDLRDRFDVVLGALESEGDDYYADQHGGGRGIAAQLTRQLADARPKDSSVTGQLDSYRNLAARWTDWDEVRPACRQLAAEMLETEV
jgi:hypothetical protein